MVQSIRLIILPCFSPYHCVIKAQCFCCTYYQLTLFYKIIQSYFCRVIQFGMSEASPTATVVSVKQAENKVRSADPNNSKLVKNNSKLTSNRRKPDPGIFANHTTRWQNNDVSCDFYVLQSVNKQMFCYLLNRASV